MSVKIPGLMTLVSDTLSWGGLVLWDEVFINTSDTAPDTVPRRPHRRGPDSGLLRGTGGGGGLYRESHRHHGEILRQTPVPALRQRPPKRGKISTHRKSTWPAPAAGRTAWTINSTGPPSLPLTITSGEEFHH